jgi:aldose 1-epimerase
MAHRVSQETVNGRTIYRLQDDATGASAAVLPSYGFNLFDLRLPAKGEPRRVIIAAPDWEKNPQAAGRNGIPILFPFPNRIAQAKFRFGAKDYSLPANNGPNAIHGFAIQAPWQVVDSGTDAKGAFLSGRYQISKQSPEMLTHWPADAILDIVYHLSGRRLTLNATVTNPTAQDLPFGFGIHPYFRLPLGPDGDLNRTAVILPAAQYWVLKDFIPTGERKDVDPRLDFRNGQPLVNLKLDDVLTDLAFAGDYCTARLVDEALGAEVRLGFDRHFRELVVYTPPGQPGVISVEPYTQTTDAIHLNARGIDAGLRVLHHGEHVTMTITIETVD